MTNRAISFAGGLLLLIIAFMPPVAELVEHSENAHFGQHVLVLVAGFLVARAAVRPHPQEGLTRTAARRAAWETALGVLVLLATMLPAVDAAADAALPVHMAQHLAVLVAGALIGAGISAFVGVPEGSRSGSPAPSHR